MSKIIPFIIILEILHQRDIMTFRMDYITMSVTSLPSAVELKEILREYDEEEKEMILSNRINKTVLEFKVEKEFSTNLKCCLNQVKQLAVLADTLTIQWMKTGVKLGGRYFPEVSNELVAAAHGIKVLACNDITLKKITEVLLNSLVKKGKGSWDGDIGDVTQKGVVPQKFSQNIDSCITYNELLEHYSEPEQQAHKSSSCCVM
jgi:hypothetical protein